MKKLLMACCLVFLLFSGVRAEEVVVKAKFCVFLPPENAPEIINGFARQHGWPDSANEGETKKQFVQRKIRGFIRDSYKAQKASRGADTGRSEAETRANQRTAGIVVEYTEITSNVIGSGE